jgi:hypothetical protein
MTSNPSVARAPGRVGGYHRRAIGFAVAAILAGLVGLSLNVTRSLAQDEAPKVRLLLSQTPADKEPEKSAKLRPQVLRPNVTQEVFAYVQNDGAADETVSVQLWADDVKVTASPPVTVAKNKRAAVTWPRPPMPPAKMTELNGKVVIRLVDAKEKPIGVDVEVLIDRPSNYLDARLKFYPEAEGKNYLEAIVSPREGFFKGPPCRVSLDLQPDRIPGFVPGQPKRGVYSDFVTARTKSIVLEAENLQFREGGGKNGLVYLTADDYKRAFIFQTTFARSGTVVNADPIRNPCVVFVAPKYFDPTQKVPVQLEVDNLARADEYTARIQVDLVKRARPGKAAPAEAADAGSTIVEYRGERQKTLHFTAGGPNGGLVFLPKLTDRETKLDLSSVYGPAQLRVRLFTAKDEPIKFRDLLSDKPEATELIQNIILDNSAPEDVQWVNLPETLIRGKTLTLAATGMDPESEIRSVRFWVGKLTPDRKIPADAVLLEGRMVKAENLPRKVWAVLLPIPDDQPLGPMPVAVQFVNGTGLATIIAGEVKVLPVPVAAVKAPPGKGVPKKCSIAGSVREGNRLQAGVPVSLYKVGVPTALATETTNAMGEYLFKDLEPGNYTVVSAKSASRTRGQVGVVLVAEEAKTGVLIKLFR